MSTTYARPTDGGVDHRVTVIDWVTGEVEVACHAVGTCSTDDLVDEPVDVCHLCEPDA